MNFQLIKVSDAYESPTNPRGQINEKDPAFKELVASVREKGVLVPIIVRDVENNTQYEVVAGNRRFRAAIAAGLKEVPADIRELSDDEAREVQIIENLQRADVHPLDEGEAYRHLIEERGMSIKDVGIRVGKSAEYVKQRLFLTNLAPKLRTAYRKGEVLDGHAYEIAKLTEPDQLRTLKYFEDAWDTPTLEALRTFIQTEFYRPLAHQPWLNDAEAKLAIGECTKCPAVRTSLFGDIKDGQCTNLECWTKKMAKYINFRKERNPELVFVSSAYGKAEMKETLSRSEYEEIPARGKKHCEFAEEAIVTEGSGVGDTKWICRSAECDVHQVHHSQGNYRPTPAEKEARKKERERIAKEKEKADAKRTKLVEGLVWPFAGHQLDGFLELALSAAGQLYGRNVAKRRGIEPRIRERQDYMNREKKVKERDYEAALREAAKGMTAAEKARLAFDLLMERGYGSGKVEKLIAK